MYVAHPSRELQARFRQRPYQGEEPHRARFLFVGLDANYDAGIEDSSSFADILRYHEDGVAFWQDRGVHHPFLLQSYRGDGRRYHRNFARIGFGPEHAAQVSFVELLHVPTVGRNKLAPADLDSSHLDMLNSAVRSGDARHIFVSASVAELMRESSIFAWLPRRSPNSEPLSVLHSELGRTVYLHLHLSNYGKFQAQLTAEAQAIQALLRQDG